MARRDRYGNRRRIDKDIESRRDQEKERNEPQEDNVQKGKGMRYAKKGFKGLFKTAVYFISGASIFLKVFSFISHMVSDILGSLKNLLTGMFGSDSSREDRQYRGRGVREKTDAWSIIKKVLIGIGIVLVSGFLFLQMFTMVRENIFSEMGDVSPGELVSKGVSRAVNATKQGANSIKIGIMTPFWKSQCQRQILTQNPENADLKIRNCVRQKQGLPPINDSEEQKEQEWELRSASS